MKPQVKLFTDFENMQRLLGIRRKVFRKIGALKAEYIVEKEPIPFDARDSLRYHLVLPGSYWDNHAYGCGWFRFSGNMPKSAKGKCVGVLINLEAEGCLVDEHGSPVQGLATVHSFIDFMQPAKGKRYLELYPEAKGDEQIYLEVEAGNNRLPGTVFKGAAYRQCDLVAVREDVRDLYYDFLAIWMQALVSTGEKRESLRRSLRVSYKAARGFSVKSVADAREILAKERQNGEISPYTVHSIGHAHLDLAWLWPIRETKRKAGRTFANQLRNAEKYPDFIFGASQPQQFQWMEEKYPALFEQLKEMHARGQLELQGGMWVECDTNLTSGESLIRQSLYGKRYWKEKFGQDVTVCWLPDVFGFSGNLPQLIKKCGMDSFLTIKLSWNEHNKFPKRTFVWKGIDGSEVLVHMPPEGTYNSDATPFALTKALEQFPEKDKLNIFGMLFGVGDGGGGPGEGHIEMALRQRDAAELPRVKPSTARAYFDELQKEKDKLEVFSGELYLEKHQGTYTSQAKNKLHNRKIEFLLHNVEYLCTEAARKGMKYPKKQLETIWKEVLLYQFHDIIPGSSIARVYKESVARYYEMEEELKAIASRAVEYLRADGEEEALSGFNLTAYPYEGILCREDKWYRAEIPAYGVAKLTPYQTKGSIRATEDSIENDIFVVKFNFKGNIVSLYDKRDGTEYVGESVLNRFCVYKDTPKEYDAWDIDWNYVNQTPSEFRLIRTGVSVSEGNVVRESEYKYHKSHILQRVILTEGRAAVDVENEVKWQETHKMLRVNFRPAVFSDEVRCDIQMGNLTRSTKTGTPVQKAQFEICAHKWVDVSDDTHGFAIVTDSKYGWRVKDGLMSLNLLRSPMWPAKDADKGKHTIKYCLYPHAGSPFAAELPRVAYQFNNPVTVVQGDFKLNLGVTTSEKNLVAETVKAAEDGEGITIRVYEDEGKTTRGSLSLSVPVASAIETDLLEQNAKLVDLSDLTFTPYEIKTFIVTLNR